MTARKAKSDKPKEEKPKKESAPKRKVTLDDLNHDPSLLDTLSNKELKALNEQADTEQYPLAGNLRSRLNQLASKEE